jgi:hypothetical protein
MRRCSNRLALQRTLAVPTVTEADDWSDRWPCNAWTVTIGLYAGAPRQCEWQQGNEMSGTIATPRVAGILKNQVPDTRYNFPADEADGESSSASSFTKNRVFNVITEDQCHDARERRFHETLQRAILEDALLKDQ